jgi:hypothetical protein
MRARAASASCRCLASEGGFLAKEPPSPAALQPAPLEKGMVVCVEVQLVCSVA